MYYIYNLFAPSSYIIYFIIPIKLHSKSTEYALDNPDYYSWLIFLHECRHIQWILYPGIIYNIYNIVCLYYYMYFINDNIMDLLLFFSIFLTKSNTLTPPYPPPQSLHHSTLIYAYLITTPSDIFWPLKLIDT